VNLFPEGCLAWRR